MGTNLEAVCIVLWERISRQSVKHGAQKSRSIQFVQCNNEHENQDNPYSQFGMIFEAAGWQKFLPVKFLNSVIMLSTVVEINLSLFLLYFYFIKENKILSLSRTGFPGGWGFSWVN